MVGDNEEHENRFESLVRVLVDYLTLHPNTSACALGPWEHPCVFRCLMCGINVIHQTLRTTQKELSYLMSMHTWRTRDDLFHCLHRFTAEEDWARHPYYHTMPREALHRGTQLTVDLGIAIHGIQPWPLSPGLGCCDADPSTSTQAGLSSMDTHPPAWLTGFLQVGRESVNLYREDTLSGEFSGWQTAEWKHPTARLVHLRRAVCRHSRVKPAPSSAMGHIRSCVGILCSRNTCQTSQFKIYISKHYKII